MKHIKLTKEASDQLFILKKEFTKKGVRRGKWTEIISELIVRNIDNSLPKIAEKHVSDDHLLRLAWDNNESKKSILSHIKKLKIALRDSEQKEEIG
jgi:hypothetical protein